MKTWPDYASSGNGSTDHLVMEMFRLTAGINMAHIPYKGAGQALIDVMTGEVRCVAYWLGYD